jgi:glycosyltransferase involved in cell wall biosynthesis
MKISVVVPVYNAQEYIVECLDSVLDQSYKDVEIILIDDGSTDGSETICKYYSIKYDFITLIRIPNQGQSHARNLGIQMAKGDYLIFLDADDYWSKDFLTDLVAAISNRQLVDYIFFRHTQYGSKSGVMSEEVLNIEASQLEGKNGRECLEYILNHHTNFHWSPCRGLIRRQFILDNDLFFEEGRVYEDVLWTPKVFLFAQNIDYYNASVYVYRIERDGQTTSKSSHKELIDNLFVANYWYEFLKDNDFDQRLAMLLLRNTSIRYFYVIWFSGFTDKNSRRILCSALKNQRHLLEYYSSFITKLTAFLFNTMGCNATSIFFKVMIKTKRRLSGIKAIKGVRI